MILHLERKFTSPTETFIANQINALADFEHTVITVENNNVLGAKAQILSPSSKGFLSTKILNKKHKNFFAEKLSSINVDVIHGHYITDSVFFHPVTKNLNVAKICSCYGYDVSVVPQKFGRLANYYYKKLFKEYDLFLAMTEEMKNDLIEIGCPKSKIKVHYHGIDTKNFHVTREYTLQNNTIKLLTIASILPVKGHLSVLRAIYEFILRSPGKKIHYTIIGDGPHKSDLLAFIEKHGIQDLVTFVPAIKHGEKFRDYLRKADVFVHPSITTKENDKEGIPGAIVEAMASGLPVIATNHGGIPYVINHKHTGLLVNEHDSTSICDYLEKLHSSFDLRKMLGSNAKKYASEELDLFKKAEALVETYKTVSK